MNYQYNNVYEFQKAFATREQREAKLMTMRADEIRHIALSCGTQQGGAYYTLFVRRAEAQGRI